MLKPQPWPIELCNSFSQPSLNCALCSIYPQSHPLSSWYAQLDNGTTLSTSKNYIVCSSSAHPLSLSQWIPKLHSFLPQPSLNCALHSLRVEASTLSSWIAQFHNKLGSSLLQNCAIGWSIYHPLILSHWTSRLCIFLPRSYLNCALHSLKAQASPLTT